MIVPVKDENKKRIWARQPPTGADQALFRCAPRNPVPGFRPSGDDPSREAGCLPANSPLTRLFPMFSAWRKMMATRAPFTTGGPKAALAWERGVISRTRLAQGARHQLVPAGRTAIQEGGRPGNPALTHPARLASTNQRHALARREHIPAPSLLREAACPSHRRLSAPLLAILCPARASIAARLLSRHRPIGFSLRENIARPSQATATSRQTIFPWPSAIPRGIGCAAKLSFATVLRHASSASRCGGLAVPGFFFPIEADRRPRFNTGD